MKHHTKDKGDKGVGYVIADLLSKDIQVCIPISEHLPFDLIAVKKTGEVYKVSVKYRKEARGVIQVPFKSSYSDSKGVHSKKVNKRLIDIVAIYCPDSKEVYYIDPKQFGEVITLRRTKPKNNQKNVYLASNYLKFPI